MENFKQGLLLWIDMNEDRQILDQGHVKKAKGSFSLKSFSEKLQKSHGGFDPVFHVNTIGIVS